MGWTLKGLSHELSEKKDDAIECYNNVVDIVEKHLNLQSQLDVDNQSITTSDISKRGQDIINVPDNISEQWIDWSEEALYRVGLLTYNKGDMVNAEKNIQII
jgi:hypothetical protein